MALFRGTAWESLCVRVEAWLGFFLSLQLSFAAVTKRATPACHQQLGTRLGRLRGVMERLGCLLGRPSPTWGARILSDR